MKNLLYSILGCFLISSFVASCTAWLPSKNIPLKEPPATYTHANDTANSAHFKWSNYFSDSNLDSLITLALENNLDLLMALQRMEAVKATIGSAKGNLFPNLNLNTTYLQRKFGYYTMDDAGNRTTEILPGQMVPTNLPDYYLGLQTNWEIDIWSKLRNKKRAAVARYLATEEGKNLVITNLIATVANTYYELIALDRKLEIIRETIKIQEQAFELISIQKKAAMASELAVKQFEAQLLNSKAMEFETLQYIIIAENRINLLLNRYPQNIIRSNNEFTDPILFPLKTGSPFELLQNRPDIRQSEYELTASKADVKAAKAAFYPSFNIAGAWGYEGFRADLLFTSPQSIAYSFAGSLVAPLLNRSAIKAQFKEASAAQQEALYNYQKNITTAYTEVFNELANISNLEKTNEIKSQEVSALKEALEASAELFKTGNATYIEVLLTQQNVLKSKLELIDSRLKQFNAYVNIYKALGGGWQ